MPPFGEKGAIKIYYPQITGIHISLHCDTGSSQRNAPVEKHNDLLLIEKKLFGKKTRKQERKANRIIALDGENSKKVEFSENFA